MLIFMPRKVHRTTRNMSFVNILAEDRYDEGMITIKHKFCGVPNKQYILFLLKYVWYKKENA